MARKTAAFGMKIFGVIWFGQFISTVGSGLGAFALGVWVYETTESATLFALTAFVAGGTGLFLSPLAGVAADRWDRRRLMIVSDTVAGVMTLVVALLFVTQRLQVWHVYPVVFVMAGASVFQGPAFTAAITGLVPRRNLVRASGMVQTSRATARIIAPIAAGFLIAVIGYHGVLLIDFGTFLFAVGTLLVVRLSRPPASLAGRERRSLWRDAFYGWTYLKERAALLRLLGLFAMTNFALGMVTVLFAPLVLSFADPAELGAVQGASAAGLLVGSLALSVWGGPERRMWGIFWALVFQGAILVLAAVEPNVTFIAVAGFLFTLSAPVINGLSQAIWQTKVPQDVQGRVFAMRQMIASSAMPLAFLLAGPLADHVFEPLLAPGGAWADSVGRVIGVGPGRGVGLLFAVLGVLLVAVTCLSFLSPRLRRLETEVPDALDMEEREEGPGDGYEEDLDLVEA